MKMSVECKAAAVPFGVIKAHIDEGVNQVTMMDLELASKKALSPQDLEKIIGEPIQFNAEDVIDGSVQKIRLDGLVFEMIDISRGADDNGVFYYTATVRPKLWHLNYSAHSRSFKDKSRIQVVDELLKANGFVEKTTYAKNYKKEDAYPVFNQLLQTGCSDLHFFKALLIYSGINYYFACDDAGEQEEMLRLVDDVAFFPNLTGDIPIVRNSGQNRKGRHVEEITRLCRAVPSEVTSCAYLADGSTKPQVSSNSVSNAGTEGVVDILVPEGLKSSDKTGKQVGKVVCEGFAAVRVTYQGVTDHMRIRPGNRISLNDTDTGASYRMLVVKAHHTFEQSALAALAESAALGKSGNSSPEYKNHFLAVEPVAPIRPMDIWTDVDCEMALESALDLDPEGQSTLSPKFKYLSRMRFNEEKDPAKNTEGIKELFTTMSMLQAQMRKASEELFALKAAGPSGGGGLIAAEVTEDAWTTEGKELVCKVKAEEFKDPITVKCSMLWHTQGGGTQFMPRAGNHVWIQRVARGRDNEWVTVGYRPTAAVVAINDPAKTMKIKQLK